MKTLLKFNDFVNKITAESGRNYKLSVLAEYKDDETVRYFLDFLLNPYITTGISDKKLAKDVGHQSGTFWMDYPEDSVLFDYLKEHNTGTDVDLWTVQFYKKAHVAPQYKELFDKLVTKNLPLGIDAKTVNKAIPGLIPTFNVMLANKYFDNPKIVEGKRFALTTKIDGGRIIAIKKNGEAKFYTRQGQEYEGLVDLKEEMEKYFPDNICLDGEITLLDPYRYDIEETLFSDETKLIKLSSKEQYKETMKITRKDGEKHGVKMLVFDCMDAEDFESQNCARPYHSRNRDLQLMLEESDHKFVYFEKLPLLYVGEDTNEITKWLNTNIANGEEGVMINMWDAPYDFKRTNNLLKVKKMNDIDLEIIGFEEGTNRHTGRLGAVLVEYKGNTVKVGSGFSDELRTEIWEHKDDWLGRTIVVQYFEETTNDNGGTSLRFPVYLDYRTDK